MIKFLYLITALSLFLQEEPADEPTLYLVVSKILTGLVTIAIVTWQDLSKTKDPFDTQRKSFKWRRDWWKYRWDNVMIMWFFGIIGYLASAELAAPIINKYLDFPELAEGAIDVTGVFIVTFVFMKYVSRGFGFKPPQSS